jgi:hypothetical protein
MHISPASPDNEAIREVRDSSKRLENLIEKLSKSTERLSKSSERLEHFTKIVISLTVLLLICTIALLIIPPETSSNVKYLAILMIFGVALYMFSPNKIH